MDGLEGILKSVKDFGEVSEFGTSSEHPKNNLNAMKILQIADNGDVDDVGILFHILPIEAETKIQISCLNRLVFKKILKDDKKKNKQFKSTYTVPFTGLRFQQRHH